MTNGYRMRNKQLRGSLLLLLGSVIWGAAFAAQRVGMDHVGPFTFTGVRMLLAWLVMVPVTAFFEARNKKSPDDTDPDPKEQRRGGLLCGLLLFAASSLQQIGLVTTGAGKAGFITALYVVLVPVAAWLLMRKNPGKIIWMGVALAVVALFMAMLIVGSLAVSLIEDGRFALADVIFEASSAMGTVGVSAIGTPNLQPASRAVLLPMMYLGRIGPLTLAIALARKQGNARKLSKYPEEKIMIG